MNLTQRIDQRQSQTLVMTPQLQQAIKLLQMSNMELGDFVEQEIEKNPLLERGNSEEDSTDAPDTPHFSAENFTASEAPISPTPVALDNDQNIGSENADHEHDFESPYSSGTSSGGSFDDHDFSVAENIAEKPSLRDHLMEQIHVDFIEPADQIIASALVEMLDESGYLPSDLELMRTQLGATPDHFESIIARLQSFDPCGIFARSLQECLTLQLREKDRFDPAMELLLKNLDMLARRDTTGLMRLCKVDAEDLSDMIAEIRQLNPRPAATFTSDVTIPVVPDVVLKPQPGGGWHVELNSETLPRVLANERYYKKIQSSMGRKSDKDYVANHWQQANWLIKALHQRATTILKVASEIVRQQDAFFIHGVHHLKPLILKDIAALVEMHESTVSRVTQHKYIATPRGIFELKYFFTTSLSRSDGGDNMSSEAVRARIREMIENEKPTAILSDDHLSMMLRGEGVDIARRTIAKYREAMDIATSAQRRRDKKLRKA